MGAVLRKQIPEIRPRGEWMLRRIQEAGFRFWLEDTKDRKMALEKGSEGHFPVNPDRFPAAAFSEDLLYAATGLYGVASEMPQDQQDNIGSETDFLDFTATGFFIGALRLALEDPTLDCRNQPRKGERKHKDPRELQPDEVYISPRGERFGHRLIELWVDFLKMMQEETDAATARGVTDLDALTPRELRYVHFLRDCRFAVSNFHLWFAHKCKSLGKDKDRSYPMAPEPLCYYVIAAGIVIGREDRLERLLD